ncbi:MAG: GNAT family N-acetyltransferase [Bacilli bacterium]
MPNLETSRLVLRRWTERDIVPMSAINADPEVMRWIGGGTTRTEEETKTFIERCEEMWDIRGFGLFVVEIRDMNISVPKNQ